MLNAEWGGGLRPPPFCFSSSQCAQDKRHVQHRFRNVARAHSRDLRPWKSCPASIHETFVCRRLRLTISANTPSPVRWSSNKGTNHAFPTLTLNAYFASSPDELLSSYIHEQLHWHLRNRAAQQQAAITELRRLYPRVPVGLPASAESEYSTYGHLVDCYLKILADRKLLCACAPPSWSRTSPGTPGSTLLSLQTSSSLPEL